MLEIMAGMCYHIPMESSGGKTRSGAPLSA